MSERIVLAYSGGHHCSLAIPWLAERHRAEVVAVTLDLGQGRELTEIRDRALASGAVRAHVLDRREAFACDHVIPALRASSAGALPQISSLSRSIVARALVELAAIENTPIVAHGSATPAMDHAIASFDADVRIVAPVREWVDAGIDPGAYAQLHHVPQPGSGDAAEVRRHLLCRPVIDPSVAPDTAAHVDLLFEDGSPVAINGVPMSTTELIECLSLIAGRHGVGRTSDVEAPAAIVLHAAYGALRRPVSGPSGLIEYSSQHASERDLPAATTPGSPPRLRGGVEAERPVAIWERRTTSLVRLRLLKGDHAVVGVDERSPQMVTHA